MASCGAIRMNMAQIRLVWNSSSLLPMLCVSSAFKKSGALSTRYSFPSSPSSSSFSASSSASKPPNEYPSRQNVARGASRLCMCCRTHGKWFDLMPVIVILTVHVILITYTWLDYYSVYKKDEVKVTQGVLGKARQECKILLGKHYGKWLIGRERDGSKNNAPNSSTFMFRAS